MTHLVLNLTRVRFKALDGEVCMVEFKMPPVSLSYVITPTCVVTEVLLLFCPSRPWVRG